MARNGSGTFTPSVDFTTEAGSPPIEISKLDTALVDVGDEITNSIAADGQTAATANLPMGGFKHTAIANATARDHYASAADVMDQDLIYYVDSGSANTYVITPNPSITAYEEGQRFVFRATNANTGASTLNINGVGATAIQTNDGSALTAGAIVDGGYYEVTYDANGSRFVLLSPSSITPAAAAITLTAGTGLSGGGDLSANRSFAVDESAVDHNGLSNVDSNEHIDHSGVSIIAGNGLTGGGSIEASRTLEVGAGTGITVTSGAVNFSISALSNIEGNALTQDDEIAVRQTGTGTFAIRYDQMGFPIQSLSTAQTINNSDMNTVQILTGSTDRQWTLTTGVGYVGNIIILVQEGTGSIEIVGAATVNAANGKFTRAQSSVACLICTATDTWVMCGDTASS